MPNRPPLKLVKAEIRHAYELAPRMKQADIDEVKLISGREPLEALLRSLEISEEAYAILAGEKVIVLGGLSPSSHTEVGIPWALTSDDIGRHSKSFCQITRGLIAKFHRRYPVLMNLCDGRNKTGLRWLKWIGFNVVPRAPGFGIEKKPIIQFISLKFPARMFPSLSPLKSPLA